MADSCVICAQDTENKSKPGVFPCLGCKQMFCMQHVPSHREELAKELNSIIDERNDLQKTFDQGQELPDASEQISLIDEWVKRTVQQVYQIADNVLQQVLLLAEEQKRNWKDQFADLKQQLDLFRENENFYEKDIENLKEKCIYLKCLLNSVNANVVITDISSSLAQAVTLQQREDDSIETSSTLKPLSFVENLMKHQKPDKQITIPHSGAVYVGNEFVLLRNGDNFTMIDLKTNSFESIYSDYSTRRILCWSEYLNGFLCVDPHDNPKIELLRIIQKGFKKVNEFRDGIRGIICMACHIDRMMFCRGMGRASCIQEWSLKDFENDQKRATTAIRFWESPLTCRLDETVGNISFDDEQIVLLITNAKTPSKNRLEFRTRGMYIIGYLKLKDYNRGFLSFLYRFNDGWLFGRKKWDNSPWSFILVDENLQQRKQEIISEHGIIDIGVVKYSANQSILAICREEPCAHTKTNGPTKLSLDLYKI